jgi:hypothetical protein
MKRLYLFFLLLYGCINVSPGQSTKVLLEQLSRQYDSLVFVQQNNRLQALNKAEKISKQLEQLVRQRDILKDSVLLIENSLPTLKQQINQQQAVLNQVLDEHYREQQILNYIYAQGTEDGQDAYGDYLALNLFFHKMDPGKNTRLVGVGNAASKISRMVSQGDYNDDGHTDYLHVFDLSQVIYQPADLYYYFDGRSGEVTQLTLGNGPELTMTISNMIIGHGQLEGQLDLYYGNDDAFQGPAFINAHFFIQGNKIMIHNQHLPALYDIHKAQKRYYRERP